MVLGRFSPTLYHPNLLEGLKVAGVNCARVDDLVAQDIVVQAGAGHGGLCVLGGRRAPLLPLSPLIGSNARRRSCQFHSQLSWRQQATNSPVPRWPRCSAPRRSGDPGPTRFRAARERPTSGNRRGRFPLSRWDVRTESFRRRARAVSVANPGGGGRTPEARRPEPAG